MNQISNVPFLYFGFSKSMRWPRLATGSSANLPLGSSTLLVSATCLRIFAALSYWPAAKQYRGLSGWVYNLCQKPFKLDIITKYMYLIAQIYLLRSKLKYVSLTIINGINKTIGNADAISQILQPYDSNRRRARATSRIAPIAQNI